MAYISVDKVRTVFAISISLIFIFFLAGTVCGEKNKSSNIIISINSTVVAAEFKTLQECLDTIKKNTGSPLKIITDKPSRTSGFLSNGQHFACMEKVTDAKGTFIDGWYTVK
jgi:hypothetical protein